MKVSLQTAARGLLIVPFIAFALGVVVAPVESVEALQINAQGGANSAQGDGQEEDLFGDAGIFRTITNVLLFLIGAVSVIMLIIGGIRYTISGGDSAQVTSAKNTILYAIVGIIVALLAYAIVNFVLGEFATG